MKVRQITPDIYSKYGETLLHYRGIQDVKEYINPSPKWLHNPNLLDNVQTGAKLLDDTLAADGQILLIVDCDLDGYVSATIMYQYIKKLKPNAKIEHRLHEAKQHGLEDHIEWILDNAEKIDLVLIPDAGSNDYQYCLELDKLGIKVLCLDHHLLDKELAPNMILINNQTSPNYTNKELTGAGIAW